MRTTLEKIWMACETNHKSACSEVRVCLSIMLSNTYIICMLSFAQIVRSLLSFDPPFLPLFLIPSFLPPSLPHSILPSSLSSSFHPSFLPLFLIPSFLPPSLPHSILPSLLTFFLSLYSTPSIISVSQTQTGWYSYILVFV